MKVETNEINERIDKTSKRISEIETEIRHYAAQTFWAQAVLKELRTTLDNLKKAEKETWIAAVGKPSPVHPRLPTRLILNLAALSSNTKKLIREALDKDVPWISFGRDGIVGAFGNVPETGLTFYDRTNIIFEGEQE